MTPEEAGTLFAVMSLLSGITGAGLLAFIAAARNSEPLAEKLLELRNEHSQGALFLAGFVALFCMMASLYLSDVAHFIPCKLCWYQRIIMYPLAFLLLFAGFRSDFGIRVYGLALSGFGAFISIYHYQLQLNPDQHSPFCSAFESCTVQYLNNFGFMSIPLMALMGFLFIFALLLFANDSKTELDSDNNEEE
ncbi:MAG: disulfide bond formation protein B [Candidatus Thalassarchaeaceae archaeon]|jgi:disulfide bond formation protein DsbB|nr:disulfide bond formation protein B [Candidatus Thalassarchaeaceae archaeon]